MWSYQIVYSKPEKKRNNKRKILYKEISEYIVAENTEDILKKVQDDLECSPDDELVAIIRRDPIIQIIKNSGKGYNKN